MRMISARWEIVVVAVVAMMLVFGLGNGAKAEDIKALQNEVNKGLRQAESDMFGGKTDNAIAALPELKEKLLKLKAADPNNPSLKSTENKYQKLVKDLERRTGKDLGGGTLTAAGASSQPVLAAKPEVKPMTEKPTPASAPPTAPPGQPAPPVSGKEPAITGKLPHHARGPMADAKKNLARIDDYIQRMSDPKWNKTQLLGQMDAALESARKNFEEAKAKAAEKGVTSHPDFVEIEKAIPEAEKKIAAAKEGHSAAVATAAAGAEEAKADVKALMAEHNKNKDLFDRATGVVPYYNELSPLKELLVQIEDFEKNRLGELKQKLAAFEKKYGSTENEIDQKADAMGYSDPYYRASFAHTEIQKGIENIRKTRVVTAEDLIKRASEMKERTSKGIHDFARAKQHAGIKEFGQLALRFDPESPRVTEFNSGLDAWIGEDQKALNAKIDKATFPKQASDAPGDAENLSKLIREFLQKEEDTRAAQGKEAGKVVAVVVTGPWRIFKKNILGEPIQYNLPIVTAVQIETEKSLKLTRVYHGTMLTQEFKGVKMAPPFIGATVGDSYYIRPSAVK